MPLQPLVIQRSFSQADIGNIQNLKQNHWIQNSKSLGGTDESHPNTFSS